MYTIKPIISEPTVRSEQTRFRCIYGTEWTDRLAYLADGGGATTDVGKQPNVADVSSCTFPSPPTTRDPIDLALSQQISELIKVTQRDKQNKNHSLCVPSSLCP